MAQSTPTPQPIPNPSPSPQYICVGGTTYHTVDADEFANDQSLNASYGSFTPPAGYEWATGFPYISQVNNPTYDQAYYTYPADSHLPLGLSFNPFSITTRGTLAIEASPIPAPYATSTPFIVHNDGYLSGVLTGNPNKYGYVEVAATEPNRTGFWPAPFWLLHSVDGDDNFYPPYVQELDLNEIFGTLGASSSTSNVQQTAIYYYSGAAPAPSSTPYPLPTAFNSQHVNTIVSPPPNTFLHTYGVLWQAPPPSPATGPGTVTYYIDRVPTAIFAATANDAFYYPEINLQVFQPGQYDGGPPHPSAARMNLTYYRWYQTTLSSTGCSSAPQLPVVASPNPSPSPASTAIGVAHSGTVFINSSGTSPSDVMPTLPSAPAPSDMLIMIASTVAGLGGPVPTGWTFINAHRI